MTYDFDQIINRQGTNAMSTDGYRDYLFGDIAELNLPCPPEELISMWIADMEFASPPEIVRALSERVEHGVFGYTQAFDLRYKAAFLKWAQDRYDWSFNPEHLVTSKGIIPALFGW